MDYCPADSSILEEVYCDDGCFLGFECLVCGTEYDEDLKVVEV